MPSKLRCEERSHQRDLDRGDDDRENERDSVQPHPVERDRRDDKADRVRSEDQPGLAMKRTTGAALVHRAAAAKARDGPPLGTRSANAPLPPLAA